MSARVRATIVLTGCLVGLAGSASAHAAVTLDAKTGPGFVISLKTAAGKNVTRVRAGTYRIAVIDRTGLDAHNFHLRGPGVNKATGVPFVGSRVWTVTLRRGAVYRFLCDPHELAMHGSFRVY